VDQRINKLKCHNTKTIDSFHCLKEHYRPKCRMFQTEENDPSKGSEPNTSPTRPTNNVPQMELPRTRCTVTYLTSILSLPCTMPPSDMLQRLPSLLPLFSRLPSTSSEQIQSMIQTIPAPSSVANPMATILIIVYIIITRYYDL